MAIGPDRQLFFGGRGGGGGGVECLYFSYPSFQTFVLDAQNNCLIEMPQHMFWLRN